MFERMLPMITELEDGTLLFKPTPEFKKKYHLSDDAYIGSKDREGNVNCWHPVLTREEYRIRTIAQAEATANLLDSAEEAGIDVKSLPKVELTYPSPYPDVDEELKDYYANCLIGETYTAYSVRKWMEKNSIPATA